MEYKSSFSRFFLCFIIFFIVFFSFFGVFQKKQKKNFQVPIKAIVQTGPLKEALKTAYLAELLNLSADQPTLTSDFNTKEAVARLLSSPVIKKAEVQIREPGIVYVEYVTRKPVAILSNFENTALDAEGYPFPLTPFFSPKNLPEIYLNLEEEIQFNKSINGKGKELAFEIMNLINPLVVSSLFNLIRIDVSKSFEKSFGQREIILVTEDVFITSLKNREIRFHFPSILRLSTKTYAQDLANYLKLREQILEKERRELVLPEEGVFDVTAQEKVIDFRIPQLAFIEKGEA